MNQPISSHFNPFRVLLAYACCIAFSLVASAQAVEADLSGSARGLTLDVYSRLSPLEINRIHSWEVVVSDAAGPVTDAEIIITGGMPEHNHGMPTQPQITAELAPGRYLLEGVRFHMPGLWRMEARITRDGRPITLTIDFEL